MFIPVNILLYCSSMHLHAGSFPLSEISTRAFGLTPGLDHSFVHSQVYHRDESGTGQRSECMGSGRTSDTEMTDDIWSVFIFYIGYVVLIQVSKDSCISRQMSCI